MTGGSLHYNVMIYIYEDDKNMRSSFYNDLNDLLLSENKIPINIMYHSYHFFGSSMISIDRDKYSAKKVKTIPLKYKYIKKDMTKFYKKYYVEGKKNIFIYGGHSHLLFEDPEICFKTDIFKKFHDLELLILDMCYGSYSNLLNTIVDKVAYVLCCQTPGPWRGYMGGDFLKILLKKSDPIKKYKKMIDNFISRNSATNPIDKKLNYRTDGVLISMEKYKKIMDFVSPNTFNPKEKDKKCKIEDLYNYHFYDIGCAIKDKKILAMVKESILYHKMNQLTKEHFQKKDKKIMGMSVGYK
jgi:hypothetical protein